MFTYDLPLLSILDDIQRDLTFGCRKDPAYFSTWRTTAPNLVKSRYPSKPPMDHLLKSDGTNIFEIAACGITKDDLVVEREGNLITFSVTRESGEGDDKDVLLHHTLITGGFPISIKIPDTLDIEGIDISLKDGILKVVIPPKPENKREKKLLTVN